MSLRKNTLYNLVGPVAMLAVSLLTVPAYLGLIGETRYGVLAIVWALLGYFGVFDLGLGRATAQEIARIESRSRDEKARALGTAISINLGLAVVAFAVLWFALPFVFSDVLKIDEPIREEIGQIVPWLCFAVPVATISAVLGGALQGASQFRELNLILVLGTLLFQLVPLGLAYEISNSLALLIPGALLTRIVTLFLMLLFVARSITGWNLLHCDRSIAKRLVSFGSWVTISSIVGPLMTMLDRFVIGALQGARQVAHYTVPFNLADRTTLIASALGSTLFPRFSELPEDDARRLLGMGSDRLLVAITPLFAVAILAVGPFLEIWIDPEFAAEAAPVGRLLLLAFFVNAVAYLPFSFIQARGRPDIIAKIHLCELLPYFALLAAGLWLFGLWGAGLAFLLRVSADTILMLGFAGVLAKMFRKLVMPLIILAVTLVLSSTVESWSQFWWLSLAFIASAASGWAFVSMPTSLRTEIIDLLTNVFRGSEQGG